MTQVSKTVYGSDLTLINLRLGYNVLFNPTPKSNKENTETFGIYEATFYVDKNDTDNLQELENAIEEVCVKAGIAEELLNITAIRDQKGKFRDCDSPSYVGKKSSLPGHIMFQASTSVSENNPNSQPPSIQVIDGVDENGDPVFRDALPSEIYQGCIVAATFTNVIKPNQGRTDSSQKFYLQSVVKIADGERLDMGSGSNREENKAKAAELLKNKLKGSTLAALKAKPAAKASITTATAKAPAAVKAPAAKPKTGIQAALANATPLIEEEVVVTAPETVVVAPAAPKRKLSSMVTSK